MISEKDIKWDLLESPAECFKVFRPDKDNPIEFYKKLTRFEKMLKGKYLYLSDEYRNEITIRSLMHNYLYEVPFSIFYEIGDWQGLIGFTKIRPEHRCGLLFKIWDKKVFNKSMVRACRDLTDLFMDQFKLKRMAVESPDERMVKGAKMLGFKVEGEEPYGFKWKNKFYTNFLLGKVCKEREV
jgi:hypothetical protein